MARPPRAALAIVLGGLALAAGDARALPERAVPGRVLVKLRAEGAHAVTECAQALTRRGARFADATADGSDSLDALNRRLRVRSMRALFRRPDARPFGEQRSALRQRLERERRGPSDRPLPDLSHVYAVSLPRAANVDRAAALYARDPHVEWAQPDYLAEATLVPDDPYFHTSGSFEQLYDDLWGLKRIGAEAAWDVSLGEGVLVGVVDSGLDYDHPDIADNVWVNPGEDLNGNGRVDASDANGVDDDGNGYVDDIRGFDFVNSLDLDDDGAYDGPGELSDADPFDDYGHGTHVTGTIAAVIDNGVGVVGVAPRVKIVPAKGLGETGSGSSSNLARSIVYAAEQGAAVLNNSWSCSVRCVHNPIAEDAVRLAHGLGAVVVFSAGNSRTDVANSSPQNMRETIVVGAIDQNDDPTPFTSFGLLVDVMAPGGGNLFGPPDFNPLRNILSLHSSGTSPALDGEGAFVVGGDYMRMAGTSMSAPHVTGVAALVLAHRPGTTNEEVRALLRRTAEDLGEPGHDATFGAGLVDAPAALALSSLPRIRGTIDVPAPLDTARIGPQAFEVAGTAAGDDFASYALSVGTGLRPAAFVPLGPPRTEPVVDGLLGTWPTADLTDGEYMLRLEVIAADGRSVQEFAPVRAERNPPRPVSIPGVVANAPSLSGDRVVWHTQSLGSDDGSDVILSDVTEGGQWEIAAGPGDQGPAVISGRLVAYLDRAGPVPVNAACWFDPPEPGEEEESEEPPDPCPAAPLGDGSASFPPVLEGRRVVWPDLRNGDADLFGCILGRSGRCRDRPIAIAAGAQIDPWLGGGRLVWSDFRSGGFELFTCLPWRRHCDALRLGIAGATPTQPVVDGRLVAWVEAFPLPGQLRICELDPATGDCPTTVVSDLRVPSRPGLSGNRLVWADASDDGDLDVYLCEYDRLARTCEVQTLTRHPSDQQAPSIEGHRVVWRDGRNGFPEVFLLELPRLAPIGDRRGREGKLLRIRLAASDPSGGPPPALSASQLGGAPLDALGAELVDLGDGRGELRWRPQRGQAGDHALTVTAETPGGLRTSESFTLHIRRSGPASRR